MNHQCGLENLSITKNLPTGPTPETPETQTGQGIECPNSTTDPAQTGNPIGKPEIERYLLDLIELIHAAQGGKLDRASVLRSLAAIAAAENQGAGQ